MRSKGITRTRSDHLCASCTRDGVNENSIVCAKEWLHEATCSFTKLLSCNEVLAPLLLIPDVRDAIGHPQAGRHKQRQSTSKNLPHPPSEKINPGPKIFILLLYFRFSRNPFIPFFIYIGYILYIYVNIYTVLSRPDVGVFLNSVLSFFLVRGVLDIFETRVSAVKL